MTRDGASSDVVTVLVVGSESPATAKLIEVLRGEAYHVMCRSPSTALAAAMEHQPALILVASQVGDGERAAVVRAVRGEPSLRDTLVAQLMNESTSADRLPRDPEAVVDGYLFFAARPDTILAQLRALLRTRAAITAARQQPAHPAQVDDVARRQAFLDAMVDLAFVKDSDFRYVMVNEANCAFFGRSEHEILGKTDFELMAEPAARTCRRTDERALHEERMVVSVEAVDGRIFESRKFPVPLHGGHGVGGVIRDLTLERRAEATLQQSEARLRSLVRILQTSAASVQDLLDTALNEAVALTESRFGYIYRYDEERQTFEINTWSSGVMPECDVVAPPEVYELAGTGIWGEVVRQRGPIIVNDFRAPHPLKRGYPEGHVELESFMSIPVLRGERIVAVVGMGNRATDYTEVDVLQLTLLMDGVWNVVERLDAEAAARREKDNLTAALAAAPVAMLVFDEDEKLSYANPAAEELFEQRSGDIEGRRCGDFIGCAHRHRDPRGCGHTDACVDCPLDRAIKATLAGDEGVSGEAFLDRDAPDAAKWVTYRVNPVMLDRRRGAVMALNDITPRKLTQEALLQERRLLRTVIDNLPDSIYAKDHLGRKTLANRMDLEYMGVDSEADALGKTDAELFPSEFAEALMADDRRVLATGMPVRDREEIVADRSGQTRWLLTSKFPLKDATGKVVGLVGTGHDVTQQRRAEAERQRLLTQIQTQARQLRQILETVPQGVLLLDDEGHVLLANPAAERDCAVMARGSGERLSSLGDRDLTELLTSPPKGLWHEVRSGERLYEVIARPIRDEVTSARGHWVMVINDATEERRVRDHLQQQARLAAVGQLAAGIAHDFNNIMAVIILYARMTEVAPGLAARDRERLGAINQQAYHATKLIEQLLDFSRSSVMERRPVDLLPLLEEHVRLLQRTLPESITISVRSGEDDYTVDGDVTRLQQALLNLAINARDAMAEGGELTFTLARIEVGPGAPPPLVGMAPGPWIKLGVADTGSGIADEIRAHLFEPFHTTKAPGQGTGLGLAQVHGIVRQHDGHIGVETAIGVGTTFTLYLPAFVVSGELDQPRVEGDLELGQGEVVLIVEDNGALREALHDTLVGWGYEVREASHGGEALALLEEAGGEIDVVLSDVVMPGMGGAALAEALHARGVETPLVLMSGHAETQLLDPSSPRETYPWLRKPLQLDELARTLRVVLRAGPRS